MFKVLSFALGTLIFVSIGWGDTASGGERLCRITVLFNNIPQASELQTGWGFACLVEGFKQTVLFDTGCDGRVLLANMHHLGIDPQAVDAVVLSHSHIDHIGGLKAFIDQNHAVTVFLPHSFPHTVRRRLADLSIQTVLVSEPRQLFEGVYSSGEMGDGIKEQALILDTARGLVIITGCAHPGVVQIVMKARHYLNKDVFLLMGGFHLAGLNHLQITNCLQTLRSLGVKKVAPSHCTGVAARACFEEMWGDDFIPGGCGAVIRFPR